MGSQFVTLCGVCDASSPAQQPTFSILHFYSSVKSYSEGQPPTPEDVLLHLVEMLQICMWCVEGDLLLVSDIVRTTRGHEFYFLSDDNQKDIGRGQNRT